MPSRSSDLASPPPDLCNAGSAPPAWQADAWVRGVAWAPGLFGPGFQLGYNTPKGFEPMTCSPVFHRLGDAIRHARSTGWIR